MFYVVFIILQVPWVLMLIGGVRRMWRTGHLYARLQCYGAAFAVLGKLAHLVIFAPGFGVDSAGNEEWTYWFIRAEWGGFLIGLLFFGMGYFLDRRPGPGYVPWPRAQRRLAVGAVLLGCVLAWIAYRYGPAAMLIGPSIGLPRFVMALGFYPFAFAYEQWTRRDTSPPPRTLRIDL